MARIVQMLDGVAAAQFEIDKPVFRIGRAADNDVFIDDAAVSSRHCEIESEPEAPQGVVLYRLRDLGSTNGTFVNGERVEACRLVHGDVIRVGLKSFKFIDEQHLDQIKTAKIKKSWIPGVFYTQDKD
jgi:pSer/pThr/pTyr-binding forkhead associated (FHA) protein